MPGWKPPVGPILAIMSGAVVVDDPPSWVSTPKTLYATIACTDILVIGVVVFGTGVRLGDTSIAEVMIRRRDDAGFRYGSGESADEIVSRSCV
jgi:hypothetical protein